MNMVATLLLSTGQHPSHGSLARFLEPQEHSYSSALEEVKAGCKTGHWMWYIFPQLAGLGYSETSRYYAIRDLTEAIHYLNHPVLGSRLREITRALLALQDKNALQVFGHPDDLKLRSSMTLFAAVDENPDRLFAQVIEKYFEGFEDERTAELMKRG